jgi:hypothetical protein
LAPWSGFMFAFHLSSTPFIAASSRGLNDRSKSPGPERREEVSRRHKRLRRELRALIKDRNELLHVPKIEALVRRPRDLTRAVVVVARAAKRRGINYG